MLRIKKSDAPSTKNYFFSSPKQPILKKENGMVFILSQTKVQTFFTVSKASVGQIESAKAAGEALGATTGTAGTALEIFTIGSMLFSLDSSGTMASFS